MKLIIAGSRDYHPDWEEVTYEVGLLRTQYNLPRASEIVSGKAPGADKAGEVWAQTEGLPVKPFPADWNQYRKIAGFLRNEDMARYADAALIFWKGCSSGSANMAAWMGVVGKPCRVVLVKGVR